MCDKNYKVAQKKRQKSRKKRKWNVEKELTIFQIDFINRAPEF